MAARFPPGREADLVTFTQQFKAKITATPTAYSLTAAQATAYAAKSDDFIAKWNVVQDPATRTRTNTSLKDVAKAALLAELRMLVKIIQNAPATTNAMRIELGIPQRATEPTPIPPPAAAPLLEVVKVYGRQITVRLKDAVGDRRGKPQGCAGATLFSFVGAEPPASGAGWRAEGNVTRGTIIVEFAATVPAGAKVWFTAIWYSQRGLTGPACTPVQSGIGYEGAMPMAA